MHKVGKLVLSEVVKEGLMKKVMFHLDTEGWTRQWGKEVMEEGRSFGQEEGQMQRQRPGAYV